MLIEKKHLETDKLLREKFASAKRGLKVYKKIIKKYKAKDTEFRKPLNEKKYLGADEREKPRRPAWIFQPDGFNDDAVYSLTCLHQLILTTNPLRIVFITTNSDMKEYVTLFTDRAEVEIIDECSAQDLINYALFNAVDPNFYIASLTQPYGRWGDKIVNSGMAGAERCFAVGVYRVWYYKQEHLPEYHGTDQRIIDFLKRAVTLQKESLFHDLEAKNERSL